MGSDDDLAELVGGRHATERAQPQFLGARDHSPARGLDILALQGVPHVEHSEVVRCELLRVEQHSDLTCLPAIQVHTADTIHRLNRPSHLLIRNLSQLSPAHGTADQHGHDRIGLRVFFGDHRREGFARKAVYRSRYFFSNVLRRAVNIAFQHKCTGNVRHPL